MSSPAQTLANQENSLHSTGPRTEAGKLRSSQNSFKHGLTANTVVLPTEDQAVYQEFCRRMLLDYDPVGAMEEQLAQTAIDAQWRLNRVAALETNILALAQYEPAPEQLAAIENPQTRAALLEAHALIKYDRQLRNLHLQEQRLHRIVNRSISDLAAVQKNRESSDPAKAPHEPENGFDFTHEGIHLHYSAPPAPIQPEFTFKAAAESPDWKKMAE